MVYRYLVTGLTAGALSLATAVWAQPGTATVKLQALKTQLQQQVPANAAAVAAAAQRLGIEKRRVLPNGKVLELQSIGSDGRPVFYITNNYSAADTVGTDELWPGGALGLNLTGIDMTIGEWDAGAVEGDHPDLWPRVTQKDNPAEISAHATHVAGTLIGSGDSLYLQARGMAYRADLDAYDWNLDAQEMIDAALDGLLVSNHSYGIAAGWVAIGGAPPDNWWWIGGQGNSEDPNFGYYDAQAQTWDEIAFNAPYYLIVKAAGNDRWDLGPEDGEEYSVVDPNGILIETSYNSRPADCGQTGYDCLPTASVAKNILTIGAVDDVPGGYQPLAGPASVQMTGFSSWGPADDGRIKPDIVANGWMVFSTYPWDPYFASAIGTSMAAPNVSGSLLLLQEHYANLYSGSYLRAATLKALAIHTADESGAADGPDYEYGWGLLNASKAAQVIGDNGNGIHQIVEGSLADESSATEVIDVTQDGARVTATLVWHDPPATPAIPLLNPTALMLVNDLDLRVSGNSNVHLPWVLDPNQPAAPATRGDNFRDNVEKVQFTANTGSYEVITSHKGVLGAPQDYSLIISIAPPAPASTGLAIDEHFTDGVLPAGWSTETNNVPWQILMPQPGGGRYDNNTGGSGGFAMMDNEFANTVAALIMPPLDLSLTESAVLRFKNSFPYMDLLESLNVDTSIDGGSNWSNRWTWTGLKIAPWQQSVDLTGAVAGQGNVRIRFRWDSGNAKQGDVWQLDDVELETFGAPVPPPPPDPSGLPGLATDPVPSHNSNGVNSHPLLTWTAGALTTSHKVYLGTSSTLGPADYKGAVAENQFDPGQLAGNTAWFWRIDEVNSSGETTGNTWQFTTGEAPVLPSLHVSDLDGVSSSMPRNRWEARVSVTVQDGDSNPLSGVAVTGNWNAGGSATNNCVTGQGGSCELVLGNIQGKITNVIFSIGNLSLSGYDYAPGDNSDSESDSNGNQITVFRDGGPTNSPPVTTINSPANGAVFASGASVTLQASASDSEDGDLSAGIQWQAGGTTLGSGASINYSFADGGHTVTASVTDSGDALGSDSVSFTVGEASPAPSLSGLSDLSEALDSRRWSAIAEVLITDGSGPVNGATVTASWSEGAKGGGNCTTGADGRCQIIKGVKLSVSSVRITIDDIAVSGLSHSPGANNSRLLAPP